MKKDGNNENKWLYVFPVIIGLVAICTLLGIIFFGGR